MFVGNFSISWKFQNPTMHIPIATYRARCAKRTNSQLSRARAHEASAISDRDGNWSWRLQGGGKRHRFSTLRRGGGHTLSYNKAKGSIPIGLSSSTQPRQ